jgi:hypothetical protein
MWPKSTPMYNQLSEESRHSSGMISSCLAGREPVLSATKDSSLCWPALGAFAKDPLRMTPIGRSDFALARRYGTTSRRSVCRLPTCLGRFPPVSAGGFQPPALLAARDPDARRALFRCSSIRARIRSLLRRNPEAPAACRYSVAPVMLRLSEKSSAGTRRPRRSRRRRHRRSDGWPALVTCAAATARLVRSPGLPFCVDGPTGRWQWGASG